MVSNFSEDATVNSQVAVIKVEEELQKILSVILTTDKVQRQIASVKIGGAVPTMTETELKNISFYIPTNKYEQSKISTYFRNLDSVITLHQRWLKLKLKSAKAIKKGVYKC